ncbi:MAG: helix-turn-helix transcriptional regulator, partial [Ilumatobacteraceae bacterium]
IVRGSAVAAIAMVAAGRDGAAALLDAAPPAPTLAGGGLGLMAQGLQASLEGEPAIACSALLRSAGLLEAAERSLLLPESPAALASMIAIHCGDLDVAESAVSRAIERDLGGAAFSVRHRLLSAWVSMLRGQFSRVRQVCAEIESDAAPNGLTLRDELFLRALDLGVARRTSDAAGLVAAWKAGQDVLLRHPVDLFMLLPLGEFAVAAARLRQSERMRGLLTDAWDLLGRLGGPHVWETTLRWCSVQAAILRNRPDEVEPHAAALLRAAAHSPLADAMAAAGRAWVHTLAGDVVPSTVEPAARGLQEFGLSWDGSRLLAQAAAHSNDRLTIAALLQAARSLQQVDDTPRETGAAANSASAPRRSTTVLSDREREVASLLVQRHTYREIGERLFISPKTVEHHVARIKQRLGASGRADLLARLPSTMGDL